MFGGAIDPIDLDVQVIISEDLSPKAQAAVLVEYAQDLLAEVEKTDQEALGGQAVGHQTYVDGREVTSLDSVTVSSTITFEFDIAVDVATWIENQLVIHSPYRTGHYQKSHRVFADGGQAVDISSIPAGVKELVFASIAAYALPIDEGESKQAPSGVYQAIAALARQRFGGLNISFGYRDVPGVEAPEPQRGGRPHLSGDLPQPAIIIEF